MRLVSLFFLLFSIVAGLYAQDAARKIPLVLSDTPERVAEQQKPISQDGIIAQPTLQTAKTQAPKTPKAPDTVPNNEKISFSFDEEELEDVINFIATKRGYNLLFPTKTDEKVTGKLTWHLDKKVTVDEAWNLLQTIVSVAGYSIIPYPTYHEIIKTDAATAKEPVPLYIGVSYEKLPISDSRIRYVHYLANIKSEGEGENELSQILKSWLPSKESGADFLIDKATNALIIMAQSNDIRGIMPIITSLDRPGFQEKMEIITLRYTEAKMVSDLFNSKILGEGESNRYRLDTKKPGESTFFSKHLKIIANERRNNLIILGRAQSIDRVRNFIKNYIDVPPDTGKSVLHVYQLQYLDAVSFAKVLENVLQQKQAGGLEQATAAKQTAVGPQRYFDEVIIATDSSTNGEAPGSFGGGAEGESTEASTRFGGGNRLIIACRNDDWKRIEQLIGKLDQPTPQVLIEVLIADLTLDDSRALGAALRNPEKIPMAGSTAYQSAHLAPGVMPDSFSNPETIGLIEGIDGTVKAATDLLRTFATDDDGKRTDGGTQSIASLATAGSTILSFNDNSGKTWGIAQILQLLDHSKILSHPHVISRSDKKAVIEISESRKLQDAVTNSASATVIKRKDILAKLEVAITPRIAVSELKDSTVNLQVVINIDQFKSAIDNTRITRNVTTNVTVNNGDILALGGLIRTNEQDNQTQTPILSQIPLIDWLFKKKSKTKQRTNLTVFISPTVIMPRFREEMTTYTKDYLDITRQWAKEGGMFDSLKDPITRWFFTDESPTEQFTKAFLKNDIRFQETPAPQAEAKPIGPVKSIKYASNKNSGNPMEQDTEVLAQQVIEQDDQLKDLFSDMENNPFAMLKPETIVQNKAPEPIAPASKRKRRR